MFHSQPQIPTPKSTFHLRLSCYFLNQNIFLNTILDAQQFCQCSTYDIHANGFLPLCQPFSGLKILNQVTKIFIQGRRHRTQQDMLSKPAYMSAPLILWPFKQNQPTTTQHYHHMKWLKENLFLRFLWVTVPMFWRKYLPAYIYPEDRHSMFL